MIGLVPDTNTQIRLTTGNGEVIHRPVIDSMYDATSPSGFRGFQVHDAAGALHTYGNP